MAKGRPRKFDRDDALKTALHLFWTHGYEGTSVALLAEKIGVNPPSLYAAFGNKEQLFLEAVNYYSRYNGGFYHEAFRKRTSYEVARHILEHEVRLVTMPDAPEGCLMIQGALVTSPESEPIREQMAAMRRMAEKWMADRFEQARSAGDLPADSDPAALACYIMSVNSGIAVQAKSGATREELNKVVELALRNWP